ncbi:MAG TPA: class II fructose-bisphosphate aldolase, partial [Verrucomicrobiae bacterium]|nr:class II fructose-bisphosphate aldolase [Verrucomicrobiae bacterium]
MRAQEKLLERVPERVRKQLGSGSSVCVLSGLDVFAPLASDCSIIMGCNPRIPHVIPGVMRAAEELDAVVTFELTRTEGGLDGGYTGQTPDRFVSTVLRHAEETRFSKPFVIHADHITITSDTPEERSQAGELIAAQLAAGYTSFALDASFSPVATNAALVASLATPIMEEGCSLEVELGETKSGEQGRPLTEPEEAEEFLALLAEKGIRPQLLAIN